MPRRKRAIALIVLLVGITSGTLYCLDGGMWTVMWAKGGSGIQTIASITIQLLTMCGQAARHHIHGLPWWLSFWMGQLAFYGFVSICILFLRPRHRRKEEPTQ